MMFEMQGTIRKTPETVVVEGVDGARIHGVLGFYRVPDVEVIGREAHLDERVRQHSLEHPGVTFGRHELEGVAEVPIVVIRPDRHSRSHAGRELRQIEPPLFSRVTPKELFTKIPANPAQYDVLTGANRRTRLTDIFQ